VCTRINRKVFQRVSKPHTVVHLRSMDFPKLVHTLLAMSMSLCFVDGHCKSGSHKKLQTFELERHICRTVGIIGMHGNYLLSSPLNFPFKIVASMILFIILVTWSLSHFVTMATMQNFITITTGYS
jgi:hypothetical protein